MKNRSECWVLCCIAFVTALCCVCGAGAETADPGEWFIDLDLSAMSGTIVYAQVYNIVSDMDAWIGKVIRMAGYYGYYEDTATGIVYHACVIPDATACCAQGIEFVWAGEHNWPEDYPEEGDPILVTGRFETYREGDYIYPHLVDAELTLEPTGET